MGAGVVSGGGWGADMILIGDSMLMWSWVVARRS